MCMHGVNEADRLLLLQQQLLLKTTLALHNYEQFVRNSFNCKRVQCAIVLILNEVCQ